MLQDIAREKKNEKRRERRARLARKTAQEKRNALTQELSLMAAKSIFESRYSHPHGSFEHLRRLAEVSPTWLIEEALRNGETGSEFMDLYAEYVKN